MARRDPNQIFHILNINIQNVLENGLSEIEKLSKHKESDSTIALLRYIIFFVDHAITRIQVTPLADSTRQSHYYRLWHDNDSTQQRILALSKILEQQRTKHRRIDAQISTQYEKNMDLVETIVKQCTKNTELTLKYERMQIDEYKHSELRQDDLRQIYTMAINKSHSLKTANERLEKEQHSKRFKVTSQYLSLINRYDTEIGSRKVRLVELQAELDALKDEDSKLQETIQQQTIRFNSCMFNIHEHKIKDFMDRLELSRKLRAVILIQRWWRSFNKKHTKKRKKKRKKKKRRKVLP